MNFKTRSKKMNKGGGITIPSDIRKLYGFSNDSPVKLEVQADGSIMITPHKRVCLICSSSDNVETIDGIAICKHCAERLAIKFNLIKATDTTPKIKEESVKKDEPKVEEPKTVKKEELKSEAKINTPKAIKAKGIGVVVKTTEEAADNTAVADLAELDNDNEPSKKDVSNVVNKETPSTSNKNLKSTSKSSKKVNNKELIKTAIDSLDELAASVVDIPIKKKTKKK